MMKYYSLYPECAGGFGDHTVFVDRTARPPQLSQFHYEIESWLGDDLLVTVGCYVATKRLVDIITALKPSGLEIADVEVTKGDQFEELEPETVLPTFVWLKITGKPGKDDFGLSKTRMVVSERILKAMEKRATLDNCQVSNYP